ncbi:serine/threonine-protein kinase VRK1 [Cephus cinctus]|uniref:non-specific serine/threonine protein kinase n=1 Tax=Cephus cinctus TaxID=211228 RepID=A0AAJ7BHR6_CEPCN|nr:serine/threonine-protein kinase VRK1 [Cephus cinctus]
MAGRVVKKAPKKKGANGYTMPEPIPKGEIFTDMGQKKWIIGSSIGVGGFGEIYCAASYMEQSAKNYNYVIKVEPHGNGPLFVEMHFYMRNAKADDIEAWKKKKKLSLFGMPKYIGSGSHECNKVKYRFVVMERYGTDLWNLFLQSGRRFEEHTVFKVALQIINVLEYIHHKTYVHADIKGGNLLLDLKSQDHVYLVDFGLASHYTTKSEYKLDPKKAHDGTIEYTSRDAHMGVPTMRGDFEILAYNIIQWLCGSLPWEKNLKDVSAVQKQKEQAFDNIPKFLKACFGTDVPKPVNDYMNLLAGMKFNEPPQYDKFRTILTNGLTKLGHKPDGKLDFHSPNNTTQHTVSTTKKIKKVTPKDMRKSPRGKQINSSPTSSPALSPTGESPGVMIKNKRGGLREIKKILEDMEEIDDSDAVYQIQIKELKNRKKLPIVKDYVKAVSEKPIKNKRPRNISKMSQSDSEPEIISKGTRSRPQVVPKLSPGSQPGSIKLLGEEESDSNEDMFGDDDDDDSGRTPPKIRKKNTSNAGDRFAKIRTTKSRVHKKE